MTLLPQSPGLLEVMNEFGEEIIKNGELDRGAWRNYLRRPEPKNS